MAKICLGNTWGWLPFSSLPMVSPKDDFPYVSGLPRRSCSSSFPALIVILIVRECPQEIPLILLKVYVYWKYTYWLNAFLHASARHMLVSCRQVRHWRQVRPNFIWPPGPLRPELQEIFSSLFQKPFLSPHWLYAAFIGLRKPPLESM